MKIQNHTWLTPALVESWWGIARFAFSNLFQTVIDYEINNADTLVFNLGIAYLRQV